MLDVIAQQAVIISKRSTCLWYEVGAVKHTVARYCAMAGSSASGRRITVAPANSRRAQTAAGASAPSSAVAASAVTGLTNARWQWINHTTSAEHHLALVDLPPIREALEALPREAPGGLELDFHLDASVGDGRFAGNPWLQELPDPLTKIGLTNTPFSAPHRRGLVQVLMSCSDQWFS